MKEISLLIVTIVLAVSTYSLRPKVLDKDPILQVPPNNIGYYNPDYNDLMASLFWVRTLQDIEVCDQAKEREFPENFHQKEERVLQVLNRKLPKAQCRLSWVYKMVDVVTNLMPDFYFAYEVGGTFLSVLVDDRLGAQKIYQKGVSYFPEKWELLYRAGYHELFEMQDAKKAAQLLQRAGERGAPKWVYALSARLYTEVGQALFAKTILESVLARNPKGKMVDRLRVRLDEINKVLSKNPK